MNLDQIAELKRQGKISEKTALQMADMLGAGMPKAAPTIESPPVDVPTGNAVPKLSPALAGGMMGPGIAPAAPPPVPKLDPAMLSGDAQPAPMAPKLNPALAGGLPAPKVNPALSAGLPVDVPGGAPPVSLGLPKGATLAQADAQMNAAPTPADMFGAATGKAPQAATGPAFPGIAPGAQIAKSPPATGPLPGAVPPPVSAGPGGIAAAKMQPKAPETPTSMLDKWLHPSEKDAAVHTLSYLYKSGEINQAISAAEAEGKAHVATLMRNYADQAEDDDAKAQEQAAQLQADSDRRLAALDATSQQLGKAKIDPDRYWANKDSASIVSAGIGVLLGGIGAGLSGGPNVALENIDRAVARDIEAQKDNLANKYAAFKEQKGIYGQYLEATHDKQMATEAAKVTYYQQIQRQIASYAATTDSEVVKQQAAQGVADIQNKIDGYKDSLQGLAEQRAAADLLMRQKAAAAGAGDLKKRDEEVFKANLDTAKTFASELYKKDGTQAQVKLTKEGYPIVVNAADGSVIKSFAGGAGGPSSANVIEKFNDKGEPIYGKQIVDSKKSAEKLSAATETLQRVQSAITQLRDMRASTSWFDVGKSTAEREKAAALTASLEADLAKLKNINLRGKGGELLDKMVPSADTILKKSVLGSISDKYDNGKTALDTLQRDVDETYKSIKAGGGAGESAPDLGKRINNGDEDGDGEPDKP